MSSLARHSDQERTRAVCVEQIDSYQARETFLQVHYPPQASRIFRQRPLSIASACVDPNHGKMLAQIDVPYLRRPNLRRTRKIPANQRAPRGLHQSCLSNSITSISCPSVARSLPYNTHPYCFTRKAPLHQHRRHGIIGSQHEDRKSKTDRSYNFRPMNWDLGKRIRESVERTFGGTIR